MKYIKKKSLLLIYAVKKIKMMLFSIKLKLHYFIKTQNNMILLNIEKDIL